MAVAVIGAVRLDVWGGENSMDHLARLHFPPSSSATAFTDTIRDELRGGYLVNLRMLTDDDVDEPDFDTRKIAGHG